MLSLTPATTGVRLKRGGGVYVVRTIAEDSRHLRPDTLDQLGHTEEEVASVWCNMYAAWAGIGSRSESVTAGCPFRGATDDWAL